MNPKARLSPSTTPVYPSITLEQPPSLLMSEAEVQPLVPFVLSVGKIVQTLGLCHRVPLLVPLLVAEDIVGLNEEIQNDVHASDPEQGTISSHIDGLVIVAVDVGRDNTAGLNEHVVASGRHRAGTNRVRVSRVPCHLDGMGVRVAQEQGHDRPHDPLIGGVGVDNIQIYDERQGPDLA
jgi:hypothetical protein